MCSKGYFAFEEFHSHGTPIFNLEVGLLLEFLLSEISLSIRERALDPVFAISIGLAAAFTRINREEKEKGRTTQESIDVLKRRWTLAWHEEKGDKRI